MIFVLRWLIGSMALPLAANACYVTAETAIGHQHEEQYRFGMLCTLSDHWKLDSGVAVVHYGQEVVGDGYAWSYRLPNSGYVFAADAVMLRTIELRRNLYLVAGTGLSAWSHDRWGAQAHSHAWLFSNRIGLNWFSNNGLDLGLGVRHYSCLWCRPNTSIDFVGLQIGRTVY
jgi:hypothetical protein